MAAPPAAQPPVVRGEHHRPRPVRERLDELVADGASVVREEHYGHDLGHVVMLDPEGNEFCVLRGEQEQVDPYAHLLS